MNGFCGLLKVAVVATLVGALTGCMGASGDETAAATGDLCTSGGLSATTYSATPGTVVTWTGSATCALASPQYQFWFHPPGGSWTIAQAYSATNTYAWDTTGGTAGSYDWQVWVREAGSTTSSETYGYRAFTLGASTTVCSSVASVASPVGSNVVGRAVSITSTASCGASTPTYQVYHRPPGGSWQIDQAYSITSVFNWDTTGATLGQHQFQIWARRQGSTASYESYATVTYSITAADTCTSVTSSASPATPAIPGQLVTLTNSGSCGLSTPTYEIWHLPPGGSWHIQQAYTATASYGWDTTGEPLGWHQFQVRVRGQGSSASFDQSTSLLYQLSATDSCSSTTLGASPVTPSTRGTLVTWTAAASGCASPTYEFWVHSAPSGTWSLAQAYSATPTYAWDTTSVASGAYEFQVWVRAAGNTDTYQTFAAAGYTLQYSATAPVNNLAAGLYHSCLLRADTTVDCWGNNSHGEIGDGSTTFARTPLAVTGLTGVTAISAGYTHTCAILADQTVRCWGQNTNGQLGDGTTTNALTPVAVSGLTGAVALTGGAGHACALLTDGTIRCWGYNTQGQLGDGTTVGSATPVTVAGVSNAVAIEAGYYHTCALLSSGSMKCWGANYYGSLGDGTTTRSLSPVTVSGLSDVRSISLAGNESCAVLYDQTVRCWGDNRQGQLGDGTSTNSSVPVTVSGLSNVASIAEGFVHGCAVLNDGTARCWGTNTYGALGDTTTTNSLSPVTVSGLSTASSIIAGGYHTCAQLVDASVSCWGYGNQGELGNGGVANSSIPVVVTLP